MIYALINRPKINNAAIDKIRSKYDPNFKLIGPHVTLVFPFKADKINLLELEAHIEKVSKRIKSFTVHFHKLQLAWDQILILTPTTGKREFDQIHDELYEGMLKEFFRGDIEFLPHITLGYFGQAGSKYDPKDPTSVPLDKEKYNTAISQTKEDDLNFSYTVDSIELISATDDATSSQSIKVFNLA